MRFVHGTNDELARFVEAVGRQRSRRISRIERSSGFRRMREVTEQGIQR
jgi:hypothetical protein